MISTTSNSKNYIIPLSIIGILFFVIGFGVGISGFLTPYLREAFQLSDTQSYLVTAAIFSAFVIFGAPSGWLIISAFVIFGAPSGWLIKKIGYKKGMVIAFVVMAIGMGLFIPSANNISFPLFLTALFVSGIGNTILQTAVNPYVTIIGPHESAATRMCLMGIMNKSAWYLGPLFLGIFMDLTNVQLQDVTLPFYIVTGILLALSVFIFLAPLPEVKASGEDESNEIESNYASGKTNIFQFPHLLLGALAIFVYVGIETLPMVSIISYAEIALDSETLNLAQFSLYVPLGLVAGYIFGVVAIPKLISQTKALVLFSIIGIIASLLLIYLPGVYGIYSMVLLGFANSIMWPAIWPLAIADLGKFTKTGASLLVMGIVGGAVIPLLFGLILDTIKVTPNALEVDYQKAYWLFIPAYLYILYFALKGNKIRN
jgi:glucose/galactose transporter